MKLKRKSDIGNLSDIKPEDNLNNIGLFGPIAMPLVRRVFPALFSEKLISVSPAPKNAYKIPKLNPKKQKYIHR